MLSVSGGIVDVAAFLAAAGLPDPTSWLLPTIYIDGNTGNDANPGTQALPWKTWMGGLLRRYGPQPILQQNTTVNVSNPVAGDQMIIPAITATDARFTFTVLGAQTFGPNISVTASTAANRAGNIPFDFTAAGLTVNTQYMVRGGARDGASTWTALNTSGNVWRVPGAFAFGTGLLTVPSQVQIQNGDTIAKLTPCTFTTPLIVGPATMTVCVNDFRFGGVIGFPGNGSNVACLGPNGPTFNRCQFDSQMNMLASGFANFCGCLFTGGIGSVQFGFPQVVSGLVPSTGDVFGTFLLDGDILIQGASFPCGAAYGPAFLGNVGIFDTAAGRALEAQWNGQLIIGGSAIFYGDTVYGSGNTGTEIIRTRSLAAIAYDSGNLPPITGPAEATTYARIDGTAHARAAFPLNADLASLQGVVLT